MAVAFSARPDLHTHDTVQILPSGEPTPRSLSLSRSLSLPALSDRKLTRGLCVVFLIFLFVSATSHGTVWRPRCEDNINKLSPLFFLFFCVCVFATAPVCTRWSKCGGTGAGPHKRVQGAWRGSKQRQRCRIPTPTAHKLRGYRAGRRKAAEGSRLLSQSRRRFE